MNDAPASCSFCRQPADRELTVDTYACSDACEQTFADQFCSDCDANLADGEEHSEACLEVQDADREENYDDDYDDFSYAGGWE